MLDPPSVESVLKHMNQTGNDLVQKNFGDKRDATFRNAKVFGVQCKTTQLLFGAVTFRLILSVQMQMSRLMTEAGEERHKRHAREVRVRGVQICLPSFFLLTASGLSELNVK